MSSSKKPLRKFISSLFACRPSLLLAPTCFLCPWAWQKQVSYFFLQRNNGHVPFWHNLNWGWAVHRLDYVPFDFSKIILVLFYQKEGQLWEHSFVKRNRWSKPNKWVTQRNRSVTTWHWWVGWKCWHNKRCCYLIEFKPLYFSAGLNSQSN